MISSRRLFPAVALAVLSAPTLAQSRVWVVDLAGAPGAHFADNQPAVDAAADGDTILVRGRIAGSYGGFTVRDKSLVLQGELDSSTPFLVQSLPSTGQIRIEDLPADKTVVLRAMYPGSFSPTTDPAVQVSDCEGVVFLEELSMQRGDGPSGPSLPVPPSLLVQRSSSVTLVNAFAAGEHGYAGSDAGIAARLDASTTFFHHVSMFGGLGAWTNSFAPGSYTLATDGGGGLHVEGGSLFAAGSTFAGGNGGRGLLDAAMNCLPSRDGGTGLAISGAAVTFLDSEFRGGGGGLSPGTNCGAGVGGVDLVFSTGTLNVVPGVARRLVATSPVREDTNLVLRYEGVPGDFVVLLAGLDLMHPVTSPVFDSVFHLDGLFFDRAAGVVPGTGVILETIGIPELGPAVESLAVGVQTVHFDPVSLRAVLGNPSSVLLLDRSF